MENGLSRLSAEALQEELHGVEHLLALLWVSGPTLEKKWRNVRVMIPHNFCLITDYINSLAYLAHNVNICEWSDSHSVVWFQKRFCKSHVPDTTLVNIYIIRMKEHQCMWLCILGCKATGNPQPTWFFNGFQFTTAKTWSWATFVFTARFDNVSKSVVPSSLAALSLGQSCSCYWDAIICWMLSFKNVFHCIPSSSLYLQSWSW